MTAPTRIVYNWVQDFDRSGQEDMQLLYPFEVAEGRESCGSASPRMTANVEDSSTVYHCSRPADHHGPHVAHGGPIIMAVWEGEAPVPMDPRLAVGFALAATGERITDTGSNMDKGMWYSVDGDETRFYVDVVEVV